MLTLCRASKGGSGATTIAALSALAHTGRSLVVDLGSSLDGDLDLALGVGPSDRPGVRSWLASNAPLEHLDDLLVDVDDSTILLPACGRLADDPNPGPIAVARWMQLASWCRSWATRSVGSVLMDAGVVGASDVAAEFVAACDQRLLVTRRCYLAIQRAVRYDLDHTGIVVIDEPGRSLSPADIEGSLGAPVVATIPWDPSIARGVDAGLTLSRRPPRSTMRALERCSELSPVDRSAA